MESGIPQHLAIILDGNRRWARARGLPTFEGHRRGYGKLKEVGEWCVARGIKVLSVFAFSTENWNRSKEEVGYLMALFEEAFTKEVDEFNRRGIRLRISGRREGLPESVRRAAENAEKATAGNTRGILNICINYGGRAEIVDSIKALLESVEKRHFVIASEALPSVAISQPSAIVRLLRRFAPRNDKKNRVLERSPVGRSVGAVEVTEEAIAAHLYAPDLPDVDLLIRTSGEQRTSGFLTWQSTYAELYFTAVHWPAFSESDLDEALRWFAERQRRFGR